MAEQPYHHYLIFDLDKEYFQLPHVKRNALKTALKIVLEKSKLTIAPYVTLGFKPETTFMLWVRSEKPERTQDLLKKILESKFGKYLAVRYIYFGMERLSHYSSRVGRPQQMMQTYEERLSYFVLYPFTKTAEWHLLPFEKRKELMGEHIKIGVGHPNIRQCLLYSYGVDDNEFIVSYEMESLEEFQDLVVQLRPTAVRKYTQSDTPVFTCIYKSKEEFFGWL